MKRWFGERLAAAWVLGAALSMGTACQERRGDLTEWTPADHDHQAEPPRRRTLSNIAQRSNPHAPPTQKNQVIGVTWGRQCATCHGRRGRGDGPQSAMVKARDLTDPEFQANVTDEQLAKVIREGKDKMPAFNLPDSVIDGLVEHIRSFGKKRRPLGPSGEEAADVDAEEDESGEEAGEDEGEAGEEAPAAGAPNAPASAGASSPSRSAEDAEKAPPKPAAAPAPPGHP